MSGWGGGVGFGEVRSGGICVGRMWISGGIGIASTRPGLRPPVGPPREIRPVASCRGTRVIQAGDAARDTGGKPIFWSGVAAARMHVAPCTAGMCGLLDALKPLLRIGFAGF